MQFSRTLRIGFLIPVFCLCANSQGKEAPSESRGMPPRATPADYQAQGKAASVTVAAEFKGHSMPTLEGPLTNEDYVSVEVCLFGGPEGKIKLATEDFSLKINGKKTPLASQPFALVLHSIKDPEWEPPVKEEKKSKTSMGGGGGDSGPPPPVKIPIEVQRAMAQRIQKSTLPEGERPTPVSGLIYFQYRGKATGIKSLELTYEGSGGKVTFPLAP